MFELYSVPSDGSAPAVQLNGALVLNGDVEGAPSHLAGFAFSSDGSRIVYRADQDVDGRFEIYSVPSAGGAPIKVSASSNSVRGFWMRPGSGWVMYLAGTLRLFRAPIGASSAPVLVSGPRILGGGVSANAISPDGSFAVYRADQLFDDRFELFLTILP